VLTHKFRFSWSLVISKTLLYELPLYSGQGFYPRWEDALECMGGQVVHTVVMSRLKEPRGRLQGCVAIQHEVLDDPPGVRFAHDPSNHQDMERSTPKGSNMNFYLIGYLRLVNLKMQE
jgi:hypothetical protein